MNNTKTPAAHSGDVSTIDKPGAPTLPGAAELQRIRHVYGERGDILDEMALKNAG